MSRDPSAVQESLRVLGGFIGGQGDAVYEVAFNQQFDFDRHIARFYEVVAYLARYGRQNVLQWGDVDVVEMYRHTSALAELMKRENAMSEES